MQLYTQFLEKHFRQHSKATFFFLKSDDFYKYFGYAASSNLQNTSLNLNLVNELPV